MREPGVSLEEWKALTSVVIEVQTSKGDNRGASSGNYRAKSASAIRTQKGITKFGAFIREYRPEITAILAGEL